VPSSTDSAAPAANPAVRWFDVRPGEGQLVARATLVFFGLIAAHTVLETARDALFLAQLPPSRLTVVYGALAALGLGSAIVSARLVSALGRPHALLVTLLVAAFGTWLFFLVSPTPTSIYCLYVWTGLIGPALAVQFWLLAGQTFTSAQGKRLFALIAAGGTLGAVAGALLAERLLAIWSLQALLGAAAAIQVATATVVVGMGENAPPFEKGDHLPRGRLWIAGLSAVATNTYLRRIGWITMLGTATVLTTDYLFKATIARSLSEAALGPFLARFYALLNAIALLVQLVVAMRVVQRIGTISALAILPVLLLADGLLLAFAGGGFAFVLLAKSADGSLRHSLHRVATELLYLPMPPSDVVQAKPVLDTAVIRITQALTALALLGLASADLDTPHTLGLIIGGLGAIWFAVTLTLRRPHLDLFRRMLGRGQTRRPALEDLDVASVTAVQEALSSPDPEHAVAAIDVFAQSNRSNLIPALILYHDAEDVLVRALETVPSEERRDWPPLAEKLLKHPSAAVRTRAVRALARFGYMDALATLEDESPQVCAQLALAYASQSEGDALAHPRVAEFLARDCEGNEGRIALLQAILQDGDARWTNVLVELSNTEDREVARLSMLAMTRVRDPRFVPTLVQRLAFRDGRNLVRDALVALGNDALDALATALYAPSLPERVRLHVPRAIARFRNQRAADLLLAALDSDLPGAVRFKALRGLGGIVRDNPAIKLDRNVLMLRVRLNLKEYLLTLARWQRMQEAVEASPERVARGLTLVEALLRDKMQQALERAARLLQIRHPRENIRGLFVALQSSDRRVHANALEFLEALMLQEDNADRELMRVASDALTPSERLARAAAFVERVPQSRDETLAQLLDDSDETLAALSAHAARALGVAALEPAVERAFARQPSFASSLLSAT
jgi:hypothetical protein